SMRSAGILRLVFPLLAVLAAGCGGGEGGGCDDGAGTLPAGLTDLQWHDASSAGSVRTAGFGTIIDNGQTFHIDSDPIFEGVRFEIDRPAKVFGFTVTWANLGRGGDPRLQAGLYPDLGYNGFD